MNNIDILEELKNKQYTNKDILGNLVLSEEEYTAISTLIAENKELKETVEKRNNKIYELDRSINALKLTNKEEVKQDYIPKSKVEEIIHNNKPHIAQEKLQSLLGKE